MVCGAGGTGIGKGSVWIVIRYESFSFVEVAVMVATVSCGGSLVQVFVVVATTLAWVVSGKGIRMVGTWALHS